MNTVLRLAIIALCIFSATCSNGKMSIHSMYDGSQVIELAEIRQLTTLDGGKVDFFRLSPDGKSIAYVETKTYPPAVEAMPKPDRDSWRSPHPADARLFFLRSHSLT